MNHLSRLTFVSSAVLALAVPALAGVTVDKPLNQTDVSSPFTLYATASTCSAQTVGAMGYSFDNSSDTTMFSKQSIDASVSSSTGAHTLHVKAWGDRGSACVTSIEINVKSSTATPDAVPSYARSASSLEVQGGWQKQHDSGTPGSASGAMKVVSSPSKYGSSRQFETSFSNNGGERYSLVFSDDTNAENFFYDSWVYLTSSASHLANLEFDINQVMANGQTVLTGIQCDGWSSTWTYTANKGTANHPKPQWVSKSGAYCNPRGWSQYTWHHLQASIRRYNSGWVTYKSIWLDGHEFKINETVYGGANLGWDPVINTQFQVDGYGSSGHVTAFVDNLKISMW